MVGASRFELLREMRVERGTGLEPATSSLEG